jgi:hypothetical protein
MWDVFQCMKSSPEVPRAIILVCVIIDAPTVERKNFNKSNWYQAPDSMKAVVQAAWLLTVAFGNIIVIIGRQHLTLILPPFLRRCCQVAVATAK